MKTQSGMGMCEYSEHILFGKGLIYTVIRSDNVHTKTTRNNHEKRWRYFYSSIELLAQTERSFATNISHKNWVKKGSFLQRFTLHPRQTCSFQRFLLEAFSHAAITARKLFPHISTTVCSEVLIYSWMNCGNVGWTELSKIQNSNKSPGCLDWEHKCLLLRGFDTKARLKQPSQLLKWLWS